MRGGVAGGGVAWRAWPVCGGVAGEGRGDEGAWSVMGVVGAWGRGHEGRGQWAGRGWWGVAGDAPAPFTRWDQ